MGGLKSLRKGVKRGRFRNLLILVPVHYLLLQKRSVPVFPHFAAVAEKKLREPLKHTAGRGAAGSNAEGSPAGASRAGASELQPLYLTCSMGLLGRVL